MNKTILLLPLFILLVIVGGCMEAAEKAHTHELAADGKSYTCPMHPQIVEEQPGTCPICFMDLVPVNKGSSQSAEIMLDEAQQQLANIKVSRASKGQLKSEITLNARVVNNDDASVIVPALVSGRIEKWITNEVGMYVGKGAPIFELYSEQLILLQKEYLLQAEQYREWPNPTQWKLWQAAKQKLLLYGMSEKQIMQLEQQQEPTQVITIEAPTSGYIAEMPVSAGQYISEGNPVLMLTTQKQVWIEGDLYAGEETEVKAGDPVLIQAGEQVYQARLSLVQPELNGNTQVLRIRAVLNASAQQLHPGQQVYMTLSRKPQEALLVPISAVIQDGNGAHVWIRNGQGNFVAKPVQLGNQNENTVEILSGITAANRVVTSGAYLLYSEFVLKKGGDPLAHQH